MVKKMDDDLLRLKTLLAAGVVIPDELANWLIYGIDLFYSGDSKTLCGALGLRRPGLSSPATRDLLKRRNDCIKNIALMYDGTPWSKAVWIETRNKRYPILPPEERALFGYLRSLKVNIPARHRILKILQESPR